MKKAVVFAGGGSKGAYQIGAWKALDELGEKFHIATGTSIGSINAGFYVQQDFEPAYSLWKNLNAEKIMVNGINLEMSFDAIFSQRDNLIPFLKNYIKGSGADVTPFHEMLSRMFDGEKFFGSQIDYALITVKFPSLSPVEITKADMAKYENPWRWIAASSACFPVFPVMNIEGEEYADGGYYDNIPIASAFKLGAEQVTVIDLKPENNHEGYLRHPNVKYIKPSRDLGSFLNFEKDVIDFSMSLGYSDTMKAYEKYLGRIYTFVPKGESFERYNEYADIFISRLTQMEANFDFSASLRKLQLQRVNKLEGCTGLLAADLKKDAPRALDLFLEALERLMRLLSFTPDMDYDLDDLLYQLKTRVDGMYPLLEYDYETAFSAVMKFAEAVSEPKNAELKKLDDERNKIIMGALIRTLQQISC